MQEQPGETDAAAGLKRTLEEFVRKGEPLICSNLSPEQLGSSNNEQYEIPAWWIRDLLRGQSGKDPDPVGVRVAAARIMGQLDLDYLKCKVGLELRECWLEKSMTAQGARLPWLSLSGSHIRALVADHMQVDGSVDLNRLQICGYGRKGAVQLRGAQIGSDLFCDGAQLISAIGPALDAEGMQVKGTAFFRHPFCATGRGEYGAVRLRSAHIVGRLYFTGARLNNKNGPALHAARLKVDSTMQLDRLTSIGCSKDGAVRLRNASIGGRLYCRDAVLSNQDGPGLSAARLEVEGSVHLERLTATGCGENGAVRLRNASIGGSLYCDEAVLTNQDGPVLDLQSASVRDLSLRGEVVNCPAQKSSRRQPVTPNRLLLDGLTYTAIPKPNDNLNNQWLRLLTDCAPMPLSPTSSWPPCTVRSERRIRPATSLSNNKTIYTPAAASS
jgi:hypothetical protein